jgi:probable HAF family extracellular repeat protein
MGRARSLLSAQPWQPAAALAFFLGATGAGAATYNVIELVTLQQGHVPVVRGVNSAGVTVGGGKVLGNEARTGRRGLLIPRSGGVQQVAGLPGTDDTIVFDINDMGAFVGSSNQANNVRAFKGNGGAVQELAVLGGDNSSTAYSLNNLGHAVGFSSGPSGQRAVTWDANGVARLLAVPAGVSLSRATSINVRGDIVGVVNTAAGRRPVIWPMGGQVATELMLLSGHVTGEAMAINNRGDTVGYSANAAALPRATLWPANGGVVDLGMLPGGTFSRALESNDAGVVVGAAGGDHESRAFVWTQAAGMQDLNTLITATDFVLTQAVGINNVGDIVATGHDAIAHGQPGHAHVEAHDLPVRVFLLVRTGGPQ